MQPEFQSRNQFAAPPPQLGGHLLVSWWYLGHAKQARVHTWCCCGLIQQRNRLILSGSPKNSCLWYFCESSVEADLPGFVWVSSMLMS